VNLVRQSKRIITLSQIMEVLSPYSITNVPSILTFNMASAWGGIEGDR